MEIGHKLGLLAECKHLGYSEHASSLAGYGSLMGRNWQSERNPLGLVPLWAWAVIVVLVVTGALIIAL